VTAPGREGVARAFGRAAWRLSALFGVVFYGVDALTAARPLRVPVHLSWELAIPYWPPAYLLYFSVLAVPWLPLWLAPDAARVRQWERRMALAVLLAGAMFLALPSQPAYAPRDPGAWSAWADLAHAVAGRYNMLPSLHVALSLLTLRCVWPEAGRGLRTGLAVWWLAMTASVLLTHQHHVADVAAGVVLALALSPRQRPAGAGRAER
jgi:hypothetical protein